MKVYINIMGKNVFFNKLSKKIIKTFLSIIILLYHSNSFSIENKIELKIENEIITSIDISKEIKLLTSLNPNLLELNKKKILEVATNSLIKEKIKKIEIKKYKKNLEINENYLDNLIESNYKKLNMKSSNDFANYLNENGSTITQFKKKLTIEALWNEIIYLKYQNKININEKKIKEEILNSKNEKISFNLSEIVFNLNENEKLKKKTDLIYNEILNKSFENAALVYSISASSALGGKLGWVEADSLNKNLKNKLSKLKIGEMIEPYVIPGGFLILKLNDLKKVKIKVNVEEETKKIIRLKTNLQLNQYSNIYYNKIKKNFTIEKI